MRIAIFGNLSQPPFVNNLLGPLRAFERAGEVRLAEPFRFPGFVSTGGARPTAVPLEAVRAATEGFSPEVAVLIAGGLFLPPAGRAMLGAGTVVVGLALSDPIGLEASLAIAPHCDLFYTQDPHAVEVYTRSGIAVRRCNPAIDPSLYRPATGDPACDVLFVGKWTARRDALLQALAREVDLRIHTHAGENRWALPALGPLDSPEALRSAICGARLVLECATVDDPAGPLTGSVRITNRPQIAAACGVASLIEPFDMLPDFFEPEREIFTYRGRDDLCAVARAALDDPERRASVAKAARARVLREHTWDHRVRAILVDVANLRVRRGQASGRELTR
ncbi:MAG: glycosyltransferase [Acidobacteriota bacterium]